MLIPVSGSILARTRAGFVAMNDALARQATQSGTHRLAGPPGIDP
ncbi:MAG TPA: hypothetical protein VFI46_07715 [Jiangellaceae bacterium]|nr:hypothetical protein [Jiangellaceae bacterium]